MLINNRHVALEPVTFPPDFEEGGILPSEAFLIINLIRSLSIERLIESGRFKGFSTRAFAENLPQLSQIISVDFRYLPFYKNVERSLSQFRNVELIYGNSLDIVPHLLNRSTCRSAIFVDGPKGNVAVRFIQHCFESNAALELAFLHDCYRGSAARNAVEQAFDNYWFSDDSEFAETFSFMDDLAIKQYEDPDYKAATSNKYHFNRSLIGSSKLSYGPTVAVIFRPGHIPSAPAKRRSRIMTSLAYNKARLVARAIKTIKRI